MDNVKVHDKVFGESSLDKLAVMGNTLSNAFILDAAAEDLLAKHGLKAEHMPSLSVYSQLTSEQILQFKETMRHFKDFKCNDLYREVVILFPLFPTSLLPSKIDGAFYV